MALGKNEIDAVRRSLLARAKVLRGEISEKLGEAAEDAGGMNVGGDYGDQAFASGESSLHLAEAGRDVAELRAIDAALGAIEAGDYGKCVSCGDEIPAQRLEAQPLALRCIVCQERAERGEQFSKL